MVWNTWNEFERMQEEMDRLSRKLIGGRDDRLMLSGPKGEVIPATYLRTPVFHVKETEDKVLAKIEIPGIDKKDIELHIAKDHIEIRAEKKAEKEVKGKEEYSYFSHSSSFYRMIPLPSEIDEDKATATYENGILKLEMPKSNVSKKKKKITIK